MFAPTTLRGRLSLAYALALVAGLVLFGALSIAFLDRIQRAQLDQSLATVSRGAAAIVEARDGRISFEENDGVQFSALVGSRFGGAIEDRRGRTIFGTVDRVPAPIVDVLRRGRAIAGVPFDVGGPERVRAVVRPVPVYGPPLGRVVLWRSTRDFAELERRLVLVYAAAIPVIAFLAALGGSAVARRGLAPLETLTRLASEIEASDLSRRLDLAPRDELGRFAATFDRMLDRLQDAFARERRFTSDASHELRAPLAVILAETELALRRERTPEAYRSALATIATEARVLVTLTRDLLAAARAEAGTTAPNGTADLAAVAHETLRRLGTLAGEKGVASRVTADGPGFAAIGADDAARLCVALVHNAIGHARGVVGVAVAARRDAIELVVRDDGPGFSAQALERGFERFWRDDAARGRHGSGLGLSIAHGIVTAAGGTIVLRNAVAGGAEVAVRLPAAYPGGASSS